MIATIIRRCPTGKRFAVLLALCCALISTNHAYGISPEWITPQIKAEKKIIHRSGASQNTGFIISKGLSTNLIHKDDSAETNTHHSLIELDNLSPAAKQIAHQAKEILKISPPHTRTINLTTTSNGLTGTTLSFNKDDLEKTLIAKTISPQELWKKTNMIEKTAKTYTLNSTPIHIKLSLQEDITPPLEHNSLYHRTSLNTDITHHMRHSGLINHIGLRFNIANNLDENYGRSLQNNTETNIRSDIHLFSQKRVTLNTGFISYAHSPTQSIHTLTSAGYLDENFSGLGTQLLYRPYSARYALGTQIWITHKRAPETPLALSTTENIHYASLIDAYYTFPKQDITIHAQAGRYLAGDLGGKIGIEKEFSNGASLGGEFSISTKQQVSTSGEATRTKQSLFLKIPLGKNPKYKVAADTHLNINTLGDDITQTINTPLKIYNMTTPLNLHHITKNWSSIAE